MFFVMLLLQVVVLVRDGDMKKYILGTIIIFASSGSCSDGGTLSEGKDRYAGLYAGVGVSYQQDLVEGLLSDNLAKVAATGGIPIRDNRGRSIVRKNKGRVGGSISFGYGTFGSDYYFGVDVNLDVAGKGSHSNTINETRGDIGDMHFGTAKAESCGIVPTVAVMLGRYVPCVDSLVYVRCGISRSSSEIALVDYFSDDNAVSKKFKSNRITPVFGLGFRKDIGNGFSVKVEGDCRLPSRKTLFDEPDADLPSVYWIETKARSYSLRVVGVYNFK